MALFRNAPPTELRREISLVLLLSALTAIVLAVAGLLLTSVLLSGPSAQMAEVVADIEAELTLVQSTLSRHRTNFSRKEQAEISTQLLKVEGGLNLLVEDRFDMARRDMASLQGVIDDYLTRFSRENPPEDGPEINELIAAHQRVGAALAYGLRLNRPPWLDRMLPTLPLVFLWICVMAGIAVWRAWRLRAQFSDPLHQITQASRRIGEGDLHVKMPVASGFAEIHVLRESLEAMRQRLVHSIDHLNANRAHLANILRHMTDGVLLVDEHEQIVEFNRTARRLWDITDSGVALDRGRALITVFPSFPTNLLHTDTAEVPLDPQAARPTVVRIHVNPIQGGGGWVLVLHDVTLERELESLQRNFLSVVTHELKTPLTVVLGYTRLMLAGKGGALNEAHTGYVGLIDREARTLKRMIQDLLDVTRLEGGNLPMDIRDQPAQELLENVAQTHAGPVEAAGLSFELDLRGLDGAWITVDTGRLGQVFGNLIGNAIKFTESPGIIRLGGTTTKGEVTFFVEDTGRGIPDEAQAHLFNRFFQVEKNDTRIAGGAGLGLYICRELVHAQGGTIRVDSSVGAGTRFTVTLPRTQEAT